MSILNSLAPDHPRATKKRVGRGPGSGVGKTCGRGHKGQKSRSGGLHKVGFEGGQIPIHRRLPKSGFTSRKSLVTEQLRSSNLAECTAEEITLESLKAEGIINHNTKYVKVFLNGELNKAVKIKGLRISAGARKQVEAAGGSVE